jgi:hypothetical protein
MRTETKAARYIALASTLAAILSAFLMFVRPWYLRWGATDAEAQRALPGDEIIPHAAGQETRAITIHAPTHEVWPWIAQLGQDRGGFYSFDLLENLAGCEMPATDLLDPRQQSWRLGDRLWMYPPRKAGGAGFATLRTFVPGRVLGFGTRLFGTPLSAPENGSWSFVLEPLDASTTRLLVRGRSAPGRSLLGTAFDRLVFEPAHFAMERRMMIALKELAEHGLRQRVENHLQVLFWTIVFGLFVASVAMTVRGSDGWRALTAVVAAAVAFQVLTLGQPVVTVGAVLTAATTAMLWWPRRTAALASRLSFATKGTPRRWPGWRGSPAPPPARAPASRWACRVARPRPPR